MMIVMMIIVVMMKMMMITLEMMSKVRIVEIGEDNKGSKITIIVKKTVGNLF